MVSVREELGVIPVESDISAHHAVAVASPPSDRFITRLELASAQLFLVLVIDLLNVQLGLQYPKLLPLLVVQNVIDILGFRLILRVCLELADH